MAKVTVKKLVGKKARKPGAHAVSIGQKRVRDSNGELRTLRTLNANSESFGSDFTYVFGRNVAKARRENKRVTGRTDVVPVKG